MDRFELFEGLGEEGAGGGLGRWMGWDVIEMKGMAEIVCIVHF